MSKQYEVLVKIGNHVRIFLCPSYSAAIDREAIEREKYPNNAEILLRKA